MSGIMATAVGLFGVAYGIIFQYWLMLVIGGLLVIYTPIILLLRSKQAVAQSPVFKKPLKYVFDENGITVSQDEASQTFAWPDVVKAVSTSRSIIIYTSKVNATIIPKKQVGDELPLIVAEISKNLDPKKNKIRG